MAIIEETELESISGGKSGEPTFNYTIVYGDTLSGIALRFGTTVRKLQQINGIANPDKIKAGTIIRIPVSGKKGWV